MILQNDESESKALESEPSFSSLDHVYLSSDSPAPEGLKPSPPPPVNYLEHVQKYFPEGSEYIKFLEFSLGSMGLKPEHAQWIAECGSKGQYYTCDGYEILNDPKNPIIEHHPLVRKFIAKFCQDRDLCARCGDMYSGMMGKILYDIFDSVAQKYLGLSLIKMVFTIPENRWWCVDYENSGEFFQVVKRSLNTYHEGLMLGMHMSYHEGSPEDPTHPHKPHIEVLMLNLAVRDGNFKSFDPYIDVDAMRDIYRDELNATYGWSLDKVVFNTHYIRMDDSRESKARGMHMCNYSVRSFAKDVRDRLIEWNFDKNYARYETRKGVVDIPLEDFRETLKLLLSPKSFHRNRWYGWMSNSVRREYFNLLHAEWVSVDDIRREILGASSLMCSECGLKMRTDSLLYDNPGYVDDSYDDPGVIVDHG